MNWVCKWLGHNPFSHSVMTGIGPVPTIHNMDINGFEDEFYVNKSGRLRGVDPEEWRADNSAVHEYYKQFDTRSPAALVEEMDSPEKRLGAVNVVPTNHHVQISRAA